MRLIKIGLGSVNSTVGALTANVDRVLLQAREMAADHVTVGIFPEQVVGGYPPEDLIQWQGFVDRQWDELERFAGATADFRRWSSLAATKRLACHDAWSTPGSCAK